MAYSGSQLKKIREERNIPLEQVASVTRIRLSILQDLEDEEYSELSSTTQTRGFLRLYAEFLGLAVEPELEPVDEEPVTPEPLEKSKLRKPIQLPLKKKEPVSEEPKPEVLPKPKSAPKPESVAAAPISELPENTTSESQEDLIAIGRELSARRRYLNITWDVIEEETHIPKDQLRNLERGDLDAFINPMQFKGLLQAYARFLNLDVAAIMIRYADAVQKRRLEKSGTRLKLPQPFKVLPPFLVNLKRFFTLDLFFGTLMILGIVGFLIWGISRMTFPDNEQEATGTLPAVAEVLLSEATPQPSETAEVIAEETPQLIPTMTPFYTASEIESNLEIVLLIRQNVWLKVTSDGDILFQGRQVAGNVLTYSGEDAITLETGNIAAIEIIFNRQTIDPITEVIGTAARLLFTADGMQQLSLIDQPENP